MERANNKSRRGRPTKSEVDRFQAIAWFNAVSHKTKEKSPFRLEKRFQPENIKTDADGKQTVTRAWDKYRSGDRIVARFENANLDADRASKAYQDAVRFSFLKLAALATVLVAIAVVGIVIAARFLMPSTSELMALREERVQLEQQVESLTRKGGKLDIVECLTPEKRNAICGKIDPQRLVLPSGHYLLMNRK